MEEGQNCTFPRLSGGKGLKQQLAHVPPCRDGTLRHGISCFIPGHIDDGRQESSWALMLSSCYYGFLLTSPPLFHLLLNSFLFPLLFMCLLPPRWPYSGQLQRASSFTFQQVLLPTAKRVFKKHKSEPLSLHLTVLWGLPTVAPRPWNCGHLPLPPQLLPCPLCLFTLTHARVLPASYRKAPSSILSQNSTPLPTPFTLYPISLFIPSQHVPPSVFSTFGCLLPQPPPSPG